MSERTVEDVLEPWGFRPEKRKRMAHEAIEKLRTRTADGPVFSADGSLAVHRTDDELAASLLRAADHYEQRARLSKLPDDSPMRAQASNLRRAAALLAAPAPADPEED